MCFVVLYVKGIQNEREINEVWQYMNETDKGKEEMRLWINFSIECEQASPTG